MHQITKGMTFRTWDDLRQAVDNWAEFEKFSVRARKKDSSRVDYRCRNIENGCQWRVYASMAGHKVTAKIIQPYHTCEAYLPPLQRVENSKRWLRNVVHQYLFITRETKAQDIVKCGRMIFGVDVTFEAVREVMGTLIEERAEHQKLQFRNIPDYLEVLRSNNPFLETAVETLDNPNGQSTPRRVFVCPVQSQISFTQMRKFMAIDGTSFRAEFVQTLLLAAGIDANGKNLLLAWAVVESENESSWAWFIAQVKQAIPQTQDMTSVSNLDKGFVAADEVLGDGVNRLVCCCHISTAFCERYSPDLESYFWKIAEATSRVEFIDRMEDLKSVNRAAAEYLAGIDTRLWVTAFSGQTFGHKTSIVVEVMERLLDNKQGLSILDLLHKIWNFTMHQRSRRFAAACELTGRQTFTDFCHSQLQFSHECSTGNIVQILSLRRGEVTDLNERVYIVDLVAQTCECGQYQDNGIPCGHAYTFILELGESPIHYVPSHFTAVSWKKTYNTNLTPISLLDVESRNAARQLQELGKSTPLKSVDDIMPSPPGPNNPGPSTPSDDDRHPPTDSQSTPSKGFSMTLRRRGRPRVDSGGLKRRRCTRCGQLGHNRRGCEKPGKLVVIHEDITLDF